MSSFPGGPGTGPTSDRWSDALLKTHTRKVSYLSSDPGSRPALEHDASAVPDWVRDRPHRAISHDDAVSSR